MAINLEARLVFRGDSAIRALDRLESRVKRIDRVFEAADRSIDGLHRSLDAAASAGNKFSRALENVESSARGADRRVDRLNRKLRDTNRHGKGIGNIFGGINFGGLAMRGINMAGNALQSIIRTSIVSGMAAIGGLTYASVKGLGIAAENEQAMISFETLLGSPEAAEQMIKDMFKFAEDTPFDIEGVRDSAKLLLAYGAPADELLTRLRSMGDAVAALGGDTNTMGRVALALGQIESKGKISAQEINQKIVSVVGNNGKNELREPYCSGVWAA